MLTDNEINNIINENYDKLLNVIGKELLWIFNKYNYYYYYEKIDDKYINKGKLKNNNKFIYIKDIFTYYNEIFIGENRIYKSYKHLIQINIRAFIISYVSILYNDRNQVASIFLDKIKEEKISDLIIMYKLNK